MIGISERRDEDLCLVSWGGGSASFRDFTKSPKRLNKGGEKFGKVLVDEGAGGGWGGYDCGGK